MVQQSGAADESVQERQHEEVVQATEAELVADQPPEQVQRERLAITAESYSGPLPHPDHLRHYEATLPGAADRIIKMAEQQSAHRREMEALTVKSRLKAESKAQWLAAGITVLIVGGGLYVISLGHTLAGVSQVIVAVTAIVGVFIYGKRTKQVRGSADESGKAEDASGSEIPKLEDPNTAPRKQTAEKGSPD